MLNGVNLTVMDRCVASGGFHIMKIIIGMDGTKNGASGMLIIAGSITALFNFTLIFSFLC